MEEKNLEGMKEKNEIDEKIRRTRKNKGKHTVASVSIFLSSLITELS